MIKTLFHIGINISHEKVYIQLSQVNNMYYHVKV